jgi:hypothetical protein
MDFPGFRCSRQSAHSFEYAEREQETVPCSYSYNTERRLIAVDRWGRLWRCPAPREADNFRKRLDLNRKPIDNAIGHDPLKSSFSVKPRPIAGQGAPNTRQLRPPNGSLAATPSAGNSNFCPQCSHGRVSGSVSLLKCGCSHTINTLHIPLVRF